MTDKMGNSENALNLFAKARDLAPQDRLIRAIRNDVHQKVALTKDQGKRDRINQLIKELLQRQNTPPRAAPWDGWTSRPMTLWIMDFDSQGYTMQEGEDRLIVTGITDQLLQNGRIQVVERVLLDTLMEELKLGTSKLADRSTTLSLGKILAARFILSGRIIYSGSQTQVSLRLIETETGTGFCRDE